MNQVTVAWLDKNADNGSFLVINITNVTQNYSTPVVYALGPPLATISSICIFIGTIFSILCIVRYCRESEFRTYFTYIFHSMLIYCLISSFISVPIFLIGYYLNLFEQSHRLCKILIVNALSINIGMVSSLAYASLERNFLILRKNGLLSWRRQAIPIVGLLIYSYTMALIFTFVPQCTYVPCVGCHVSQLKYLIPWVSISFFLPEVLMCCSTVVLIVRLYRHRAKFNRRTEWNVLQRIVIQMAFYVVWSCLYYCPPTLYNLTLLIDPDQYSPQVKTAMNILSTVGVQSYPILTFILMNTTQKPRRTTKTKTNLNESVLRLNALSTSTEQPPFARTF